jgi:hypothetical protein
MKCQLMTIVAIASLAWPALANSTTPKTHHVKHVSRTYGAYAFTPSRAEMNTAAGGASMTNVLPDTLSSNGQ